jgi:hypothetical protein
MKHPHAHVPKATKHQLISASEQLERRASELRKLDRGGEADDLDIVASHIKDLAWEGTPIPVKDE